MYVLSPTMCAVEGNDVPSCADQTLCACLFTSAFFLKKKLGSNAFIHPRDDYALKT